MSLPITDLSSLVTMQDIEDQKPRVRCDTYDYPDDELSKVSWLDDILVFRSSILPTVLRPVLAITLLSAVVAFASLWWGKEVGLTNSVGEWISLTSVILIREQCRSCRWWSACYSVSWSSLACVLTDTQPLVQSFGDYLSGHSQGNTERTQQFFRLREIR